MGLSDSLREVRDRIVAQAFATDDQRRAMFARMESGSGGVGAPIGGTSPRGTRAGRYVDSGGINAKGQAAKTQGIHTPTNRRPGRTGARHVRPAVPLKTQVAEKLGLSQKQLAQVTHAVSKKSPTRLAAGAKLHTRLAANARAAGHRALAAQHKQAAAIHAAALRQHHLAAKLASTQKKVAAGEKKLAHTKPGHPIHEYAARKTSHYVAKSLRSHLHSTRSRVALHR